MNHYRLQSIAMKLLGYEQKLERWEIRIDEDNHCWLQAYYKTTDDQQMGYREIMLECDNLRDTTHMHNQNYRTKDTRDDKPVYVEYQFEKIKLKCGNIRVENDNAFDGFGTRVYADEKDIYHCNGLAYKTVDVRFREGEPIIVTMEVVPMRTSNAKDRS